MGTGHVASGLATGIYTSVVVAPAGPKVMACWVAVWAGATLLPDLDHPSTRVARMWGPLSGGLRVRFWKRGKRRRLVPGITDLVETICGGHRRGSHSVVGLLALLVLVWSATWFRFGSALVLAICAGLVLAGFGALWPGKDIGDFWPINLVLSAAVGMAAYQHGWHVPGWVPWAMAGGAAVHIMGDIITIQGCPLGWPTAKYRLSLLPLHASGFVCCWVLTPLFGALFVLRLAELEGFHPWAAIGTIVTTSWR